MKKSVKIVVITLMLLSLIGCSQKEASVVRTYEATDGEGVQKLIANNQPVTLVTYYEMSDGTWKTEDHTYPYRVEVTGRMNGASKDSTFVYLSTSKEISFDQAWKASGLSSNLNDYFKEEDAKLVAMQ